VKPIKTSTTNHILMSSIPEVDDLPVTRFKLENGTPAVQSCWKLSQEEIEEVAKNGKIYFSIYGNTHPPICLSTEPIIKEVDA